MVHSRCPVNVRASFYEGCLVRDQEPQTRNQGFPMDFGPVSAQDVWMWGPGTLPHSTRSHPFQEAQLTQPQPFSQPPPCQASWGSTPGANTHNERCHGQHSKGFGRISPDAFSECLHPRKKGARWPRAAAVAASEASRLWGW